MLTALLAADVGASTVVAQPCPMRPRFKAPLVFCSVNSAGPCAGLEGCQESRPTGLALGLLVGNDNRPDVVICNSNLGTVSIFRNTGHWDVPPSANCALEHVTGSPFDVGGKPNEAELADVDFDGDLDVIVAVDVLVDDRAQLTILKNNNDGTFASPLAVPLDSRFAADLVAWDFDTNGTVDVVVAGTRVDGGSQRPRAELVRQQPPGTFHSVIFEMSASVFGQGVGIDKGEIRQPTIPGRPDVVMVSDALAFDGMGRMLVLINDTQVGNQIFAATETQSSPGARGVAIGHFFTTSKRASVAVTTRRLLQDSADVWHADLSGTFDGTPAGIYLLNGATDPFGVAVSKLSPDQLEDFVVAARLGAPCSGHGGLVAYTAYGYAPYDGRFCEPPNLFCVDPGGQPKPQYVECADMNSDGFPDVVTTHTTANQFSVLLNDLFIIPGGF